jgi:hypothetical protein
MGFHDFMNGQAGEVLEAIKTEKKLSDELTAKLAAAIEGYNGLWASEHGVEEAETAAAAAS